MAPGTHLLPHCGPTNARLRLQLPLSVPQGEPQCARMRVGPKSTTEWTEGRWLAFDDSYEHEEWNECGGDLVVLSVDVPHPDVPDQANKFNRMAKSIFAQL